MSKKLWGGRFNGKNEEWIDAFGASIEVDQALVLQDIQGSLAHVAMQEVVGMLTNDEAEQIRQGLEKLLDKAKKGELEYTIQNEDIHLNIEALLHEEIGAVAGKLHTARSRNDQVATDMHLWVKEVNTSIIQEIEKMQQTFVKVASSHIETLLPGMTHLQHAQPISLAHHLLAYVHMFERDKERFTWSQHHADISPLGAAALAGTTFPIDRFFTAEKLGFKNVYANSLDAVSDRDFILELLSNAAILSLHMSRLCEELILWCSHEYQFITLSDTYSTGSSIMPQKKNPDMAELVRGKTGRIYGNLFGLLTTMKSLPLAYNKDLQEDKEGMIDSAETVLTCIKIVTGMIETMTINEEKMSASVEQDFSNATELADYLASIGIPFRKAHEIVGKLVLECIQTGKFLQDIPLCDYQTIVPEIKEDIYSILSAKSAVARRTSFGGTGFEQVEKQIHFWYDKLNIE
ncbi:argininosuccinate lyase [Pilibacter termitis]|uniref:Argininosuccinate lyase n=1 Tax=Pilibacter termitis TaxID=263852 RepID=A0A1T4MRX6_9ENTE|nr:argininosuccinate lyase [Pilibacter termitis]SJZ69586.1 argininosuccinate lyase [Pilibacter termitis]